MKLKDLLKDLEVKEIRGDLGVDINGIAYDSKAVKTGYLFIAIRGTMTDGHHFIDDAVKKGAACVISEEDQPISAPHIVVQDSRYALAIVSKNFFGSPAQKINTIGVTGTNGKTTITYLLESIFISAGVKPGVIGTINYRFAGQTQKAPITTPQSLDLQAILATMREQGVSHAVIEASSHGIDQHRLTGIDFDGCIFTNISQDHLDYHKTMEDYASAKSRLFHQLLPFSQKENRFVVINIDDPVGQKIIEGLNQHRETIKIWAYGVDNQKDTQIHPIHMHLDLEGIKMEVRTPGKRINIESKLIGKHNAYNILASVGTSVALDVPIEKIKEGVEKVKVVPGRMERVENDLDLIIFVDYAHTADALEKVLNSIKPFSAGRVITVFGCGGDRDQEKRPLMARAAWKNSDLVIVTSDNPRTENPDSIISDIEKGFPQDADYIVITDRREAIARAVGEVMPGDLLIIAGKGHEDYQIIGTKRVHFDDREVIREALNDRM